MTSIWFVQLEVTLIIYDNQENFVYFYNLKNLLKIKYFKIQEHFIREKIEDGIINKRYYAIKDVFVNFLTK